jgi:hypothetical protein
MERNTVLLDVSEYNRLRDFEREIKMGNTLPITEYNYNVVYHSNYITESDAVAHIAKANASLVKQIKELKKANEPKSPSLEDVKKMSYWQFRKWKRSQSINR